MSPQEDGQQGDLQRDRRRPYQVTRPITGKYDDGGGGGDDGGGGGDDDDGEVICVTQQTVFHFKVLMGKLPIN